MTRVLISGGTGFIGRSLVERLLARSDEVTVLTRRAPSSPRPGVRFALWDPNTNGEWQRELEQHDAVIHLAGSPAVGRRYTEAVRRDIMDSRVHSTAHLVSGIERAAHRPKVFVCASGVGFYGARDDSVEESAAPGDDFLARVCVEWEGTAAQVERLGVRRVSARIGFVLGRDGGALERLVPLFKAGIGGKLGNGKQKVSWIHLDDVVGAFLHALDDATLSGPMNVTAPTPTTNAELTRQLAEVLHRPALLPAPSFALRALFGEGADPLLTGQAALPRALLEHGYTFRFTELRAALKDLLRS